MISPIRTRPHRRLGRPWLKLAATLLALVLSPVALAQGNPDVSAFVSSQHLGAGYAQMLALASTPDIAAASYDIESSGPNPKLDAFRLPYQAKWLPLSADADLYWRAAGGYLRLRQDLPVEVPPNPSGGIASRWTGYSGSGGLLAKWRLGTGFTLEPAIDVGLARLENSASYSGIASVLQPLFDGPLFNWRTNAWLVTPSIALAWAQDLDEARFNVRGHVARSWISSFDESADLASFSEAVNVYSVRADYTRATGLRVNERPLNWLATVGIAGFFGANRDVLGFKSVAEFGGGLEVPLAAGKRDSERLRLAAAYLYGPEVRGWTVGLSVQY